MKPEKLSRVQKDNICQVSQQGMVHAAGVLSRFLRRDVEVEVADAWMSDCALPTEPATELHVGVLMQVTGDFVGGLLLVLSEASVVWLMGQLVGEQKEQKNELESSALREVGNIMASSFLASLDEQLGIQAMPSPPTLIKAPLDELLQNGQPSAGNACLIIRTCFKGVGSDAEKMQGAIYLFSQPEALESLLKAIGEEPG